MGLSKLLIFRAGKAGTRRVGRAGRGVRLGRLRGSFGARGRVRGKLMVCRKRGRLSISPWKNLVRSLNLLIFIPLFQKPTWKHSNSAHLLVNWWAVFRGGVVYNKKNKRKKKKFNFGTKIKRYSNLLSLIKDMVFQLSPKISLKMADILKSEVLFQFHLMASK